MNKPLFNLKGRMGSDSDWYVLRQGIDYDESIRNINNYAKTFRELVMEPLSSNDPNINYIVKRNFNPYKVGISPITNHMWVVQARTSFENIDRTLESHMPIFVVEPIDVDEVSATGSHVYISQIHVVDGCGEHSDYVFGAFNNYEKACKASQEECDNLQMGEEDEGYANGYENGYSYTVTKEDLL